MCDGPEQRLSTAGKPSALQQALMKFADRTTPYVIDPAVCTEFDGCDEAYEYYNLYSWEVGFGIRIGKKRMSESKKFKGGDGGKQYQLDQEFYCSCRVSGLGDLTFSIFFFVLFETFCAKVIFLYRVNLILM